MFYFEIDSDGLIGLQVGSGTLEFETTDGKIISDLLTLTYLDAETEPPAMEAIDLLSWLPLLVEPLSLNGLTSHASPRAATHTRHARTNKELVSDTNQRHDSYKYTSSEGNFLRIGFEFQYESKSRLLHP